MLEGIDKIGAAGAGGWVAALAAAVLWFARGVTLGRRIGAMETKLDRALEDIAYLRTRLDRHFDAEK